MPKMVDRPSKEVFVRLWHDVRLSKGDVARRLNVSQSCARQMAIDFGLSTRRPTALSAAGVKTRDVDPTPEEIRQRCLEVQEKWGDSDYRSTPRVGLRCYAYDGRNAAFTAYGM